MFEIIIVVGGIVATGFVVVDFYCYKKVDDVHKTRSRYMLPGGGLYLFLKHGRQLSKEEDIDAE